ALVVGIGLSVVKPMLDQRTQQDSVAATANFIKTNITTLKIVYGTEKEEWFRDAITRFQQQNPSINIVMDGEGSMDAYQALSQMAPDSTSIARLTNARDNDIPAVWSPASTIQVNLLNDVNQMNNKQLAADCKSLVLSPLVIMVWDDRAQALTDKYGPDGVTFDNLVDALDPAGKIKGTWGNLGGSAQASWGLIKIGHTDPRKSNSGVMMLVALANNKFKQIKAVTGDQVSSADFASTLGILESGLGQAPANSTGTFINDVIAKGPAAYDVVIAYEALGIANYANAKGRQQQGLHFYYPQYNLYSDHPFCIIDHPSISDKQRAAAQQLQDFLLTTDIQRLALKYGFRPADTSIPIFSTDPATQTDFDRLKSAGVSPNIGQLVNIPDGPTINNLLAVWQRTYKP
ncbi:MAG TPA: extracellular solute-binding protein, partial [Aggregatilineales bacterium]|nr:extracellular solute-binding protein [Aggregatilineales bacterium]